jgi:hypothetical protein
MKSQLNRESFRPRIKDLADGKLSDRDGRLPAAPMSDTRREDVIRGFCSRHAGRTRCEQVVCVASQKSARGIFV